MAAEKHTIKLIDKDGNQSEVTLPGFALDKTQEQLIKSVQALGKMNPKTAKAYEDLIKATKDTLSATEDATDQQKKDAKALQSAVQTAGDKQVSALRQFRMNFADRVGKDMRDTFSAGGNILTAAIKTATVGLAAGAGLLYKTFMDTSEAFRSLAQQGLGGAGASGTEAQDAVANLTRLGLSASEAASMLTSFGRASAVLGKANFSKFVSGIATSSTFAADLGLTLEEAAEFAAEEIDIRQRAFAGQMQLNEFNRISVMEAIEETQRFAGVMGRSMKDINASKKAFIEDNSNISGLMLRLGKDQAATVLAQINKFNGAAAAIGGDYEKLMQGLLNAAAKQIPIQDSNLQAIMAVGPAGTRLGEIVQRMSKDLNAGDFSNVEGYVNEITNTTIAGGREFNDLLRTLAGGGNELAGMILNAAASGEQGRQKLAEALKATAKSVNDPMVTAAANFQNTLKQVSGAFTTVRNSVLAQFAGPLNRLVEQLTNTGLDLDKLSAADKAELDERVKRVNENARLTEEQKQNAIQEIYNSKRSRTFMVALSDGLEKVAKSFMQKFFPNLDKAGDGVGGFVQMIITETDKFFTNLKEFIDSLEGDTFGAKIYDALGKGLVILFEAGVTLAWSFAKNVIAEHWGKILTYVMVLMGAAVAKTFVLSAVSALAARQITGAGTSAASAVSSAGNTLAAVIRRVAGQVQAAAAGLGIGGGGPVGGGGDSKGGKKGGILSRILGKASIIGIGTSLLGGVAANELAERGHNKTAAAVDTAAMVAGGASLGAMIGTPFGGVGAVPGAVIGGAIGGAGALALGMYQNWNTWFGSPEAEQAVADKGQKAIEDMDAAGMAAMAMDPEHIKAVGLALKDFNGVSVANISAGLKEFNPNLTALFDVITKLKVQFVEIVNNKLGTFLKIITGLNTQGAILPTTTAYIDELTQKIISIPVDPIVKLSTAFNALTSALKDFGDLTTDTRFGRMWDAFTGKEDQTESVIKVLNNFASKVDSEKLLKAAQATQAYNAAMQGMMATPVEADRTSAAQTAKPATDAAKTSAVAPQQMNPYGEMERLLRLIESYSSESSTALKRIRDGITKMAE